MLPKPEGIMGLPESVYVDHGKDFRSRYLEGTGKFLGKIPSEQVELFAQAQGMRVFGSPVGRQNCIQLQNQQLGQRVD